ncbi:MAG TPA: UrcA family protein [Caulobacteraceae bacterium]|nr:UrcA family protein [Caulobacteraceae bacterium]
MNKSILTVVLAAALASGAGSAAAFGPRDHRTVSTVVRFGDLNLASADGAKAMLIRIRHAARQVCEPAPESVLEYPDWRNCVAKATDGAVASLNAPMVTAAYSPGKANPVRLAEAAR